MPERSKQDFLDVLASYQRERVLFESSTRGRRYRVIRVDQSAAEIERVDGGATEAVTLAAFERVAQDVYSRGSLPLDEVPGNRVQGATIAQARNIGLSVDRKELIDLRDDEKAADYFARHFRALRVDRSGGAPKPYKPAILDVVLRAVESGELTDNRIEFDWLLPRFESRLRELGFEGGSVQAAYAFANLASDIIWLLAYKTGAPPFETSSPSAAQVRERVSHARLPERLWSAVQELSVRERLLRLLEDEWFSPTEGGEAMQFQSALEKILDGYLDARHQQFGSDHPMWKLFDDVADLLGDYQVIAENPELKVRGSVGAGNWAHVPWIAVTGPGQSIRDGVYCVYLFRKDMTGVYATLNQGVTVPTQAHGTAEGRAVLRRRAHELRRFCTDLRNQGFRLDDDIDLRVGSGLGQNYEASTVAYKLYERGQVPQDAELKADLAALSRAYRSFLNGEIRVTDTSEDDGPNMAMTDFTLSEGVESVINFVAGRGFIFEPWHIAQYVTALRTKPFVILAGITGTGKSKLPGLVAEATGSERHLVPVRPDWTDSSDVLGYTDLQGVFRPGRILEVIRDAIEQDDRHQICIIDEMNLARVEQYFAEILSHIEDRRAKEGGGFGSRSLLGTILSAQDEEWSKMHLPPNLGLIGTVNMDESAHGFSRKVLDRAFTIELSDVDLSAWKTKQTGAESVAKTWPITAWHPRAIMLGQLKDLAEGEIDLIDEVIESVIEVNAFLRRAQLQVGYRSRDEIALFVLHAQAVRDAFRDRDGTPVDPFDLAIQMKVLPRIIGGSNGVRHLLSEFLGWAHDGRVRTNGDDVREIVAQWDEQGRGEALAASRLPRTSARLALMWERLELEGFTSFWL